MRVFSRLSSGAFTAGEIKTATNGRVCFHILVVLTYWLPFK